MILVFKLSAAGSMFYIFNNIWKGFRNDKKLGTILYSSLKRKKIGILTIVYVHFFLVLSLLMFYIADEIFDIIHIIPLAIISARLSEPNVLGSNGIKSWTSFYPWERVENYKIETIDGAFLHRNVFINIKRRKNPVRFTIDYKEEAEVEKILKEHIINSEDVS